MNRMTSKGHESIFRMIAARAYHIYEDEGCPADKALDHWLRLKRRSVPSKALIRICSSPMLQRQSPKPDGGHPARPQPRECITDTPLLSVAGCSSLC